MDITSVPAQQTEESNDDTNKKSVVLAHKNLSRKKCFLAEDISEIRQSILELTTHSDSFSDEEACSKDTLVEPIAEDSNDIVVLCESQTELQVINYFIYLIIGLISLSDISQFNLKPFN